MKSIIAIILIVSLLSISYKSFAQTEQMKINDNNFTSVFSNVKSGKYEGTANGVLLLKNSEGKNIILDFQGSNCNLTLEKDENEVYDVSWKHYAAQTTSGKTHVKYDTYGLGNELFIEYQGQFYNVGSLDGASDMVIGDLSYTYMAEKETEYLILSVTKEVKLSNYQFLLEALVKVDKKNAMNRIQKEVADKEQFIYLQPNSVIVFAIKRKV